MSRAILTVVGKDSVGIIAGICTYLAEHGVNILDIRQTIVDDFFHMMMVVDLTSSKEDFPALTEGLRKTGEGLGVVVHCQKEEIFTKMHRI